MSFISSYLFNLLKIKFCLKNNRNIELIKCQDNMTINIRFPLLLKKINEKGKKKKRKVCINYRTRNLHTLRDITVNIFTHIKGR